MKSMLCHFSNVRQFYFTLIYTSFAARCESLCIVFLTLISIRKIHTVSLFWLLLTIFLSFISQETCESYDNMFYIASHTYIHHRPISIAAHILRVPQHPNMPANISRYIHSDINSNPVVSYSMFSVLWRLPYEH